MGEGYSKWGRAKAGEGLSGNRAATLGRRELDVAVEVEADERERHVLRHLDGPDKP